MSSPILIENNPYFKYDMDRICIVCHHKLIKNQSHSILDELSNIEPKTYVFKALEFLSNFKQVNCQSGPQKICQACFNNTIAALRFQRMCDKSVKLLEDYLQHQQDMENKLKTIITKPEISAEVTILTPESTMILQETTINTELLNNDNDEKEIEELSEPIEIKGEFILKGETTNEINKLKSDKSIKGARVKCKICHKYYREDYLTSHWRVHTGEKPYICKICDRRFRNPTDLKKHTVIHADKREFLCNVCGKSFKLQSTLFQHTKIHTGERQHTCDVCGKKFRAHNTLKEHSTVHSSDRPFACEQCAKCFATRKHLRQHMISHAEVKRHECHFCGNRFTQAHSLRTHLSKHCKGSS